MDNAELIRDLRKMLPNKVDYAEMVGAEGTHYGYSCGWEDPEPYIIDSAITAITALQTENAALREAARWIPVGERLPDEGQRVEIQKRQKIAEAHYDSSNQFWPWKLIGWPSEDVKDGLFSRSRDHVTHWRRCGARSPKEDE